MAKSVDWQFLWKSWVAPTKLPNVWRKKEGGFLVRARVQDPTTGKLREVKKTLMVDTEVQALNWLEDRRAKVRSGLNSAGAPKMLFSEFAASLFEQKVQRGDIKSRAGRDRWKYTLGHLIAGTQVEGESFVPGFGDMFVSEIRPVHIDNWTSGLAPLVQKEHYSPVTVNSWISILKVIMKAATRKFELPKNAMEGIVNFDTSLVDSFPAEAPNSLPPKVVALFLAEFKERYPQFFALAVLGFLTGLRPSTLRPLRRSGESPDVLWDEGKILLRQSQTRGPEVMNSTKTMKRYDVHLPEEAMAVLRWHVETQLRTDAQRDSVLLFPSIKGGFRAPSVLNEPFAEVSRAIGLKYIITQKGMRRTFQDLARTAQVADLVTRSISGHADEKMQRHYSTVGEDEQRDSLAKVIQLVVPKRGEAGGAPGGAPTSPGGAPNEKRAAGDSSSSS